MSRPTLRGATAVRDAVATYLTTAVPAVIDQARTDWGVDEYQLPYPVAYDAYEPYALDRWPLLGINVVQANGFNHLGISPDMSQQYLSQYTVRVFTWVRTPMDEDEYPLEPEYSESIRLRDDLAACVRVALLRSGSLGSPNVMWDEGSLSEEYSETTAVKGDRYVAGVVHSLTLKYRETVPFEPIGSAGSIDTTTHSMSEAFVNPPPFAASLTAMCDVL